MNVKPLSCLLALSLLALPIFSQQPQKALASVDQNVSPITILKATIDVSSGKFGTAELVVSPVSSRKLDEVTLLVTYWKGDVPIGGHCARVSAQSLYDTGVAKVSLSTHLQEADRVLFSVASALSGDRIWKRSNKEQGSQLLKSQLSSLGGKLSDEDWVLNKHLTGSFDGGSGCTLNLGDCTTSATQTCGEGKVGGVSFSQSTCSCCFYCSGQTPPNCGGGGGDQ